MWSRWQISANGAAANLYLTKLGKYRGQKTWPRLAQNPSDRFGVMGGSDRANIGSFTNKPLNFLETILQSKKGLGRTSGAAP
jgi:hypothetical protein